MFARYSGIGVGHHAQYHPPKPPNENGQNTDCPEDGLSTPVDEGNDTEHSDCTGDGGASIREKLPGEDEEYEESGCDSDSGLEDADEDEDSENTGDEDYETDEDFAGNASDGDDPEGVVDTSGAFKL